MLNPTDKLPSMRLGEDLCALALRGVIGQALKAGRQPLIRGLPEQRLQAVLATLAIPFPGAGFAADTGAWDSRR
jgi:hypothetical protein